MSMFTAEGRFNPAWLEAQSTERLRYEARCQRVHNWRFAFRHTLLVALRQLPIVPVEWVA
jgi:hypothetical protein